MKLNGLTEELSVIDVRGEPLHPGFKVHYIGEKGLFEVGKFMGVRWRGGWMASVQWEWSGGRRTDMDLPLEPASQPDSYRCPRLEVVDAITEAA